MRHKLFKYITIGFLVTQLFPPVWLYIPVGGALVLAGYVGLSVVLLPNLLKSKVILFLSIYTLITFLLFLTGNKFFNTINSVIIPFLTVMSSLLIVNYSIKYKDISFVKTVIYSTFLLLITITIISLPFVYKFPNIIRGASIYAASTENITEFYWVIGYGVVHGLTVIFAPLGFFFRKIYKSNKFSSILWLGITLLLLYIVYLSNATTALIFSIFSFIGGILINISTLSKKSILKFVFFGIVSIFIFNKTTIVAVLDSVQPLFNENGSNYKKIDDIKDSFIYGDTDGSVGAREDLYDDSLTLFLESPIIGTTKGDMIGLHSYFLDRLAALGILLIIPLILMFVSHIKSIYQRLERTRIIYLIGCMTYIIMLSLKNEFGTGTFLFAFAILPLFCFYIENVLNITNNENRSFNQKS